MACATDPTQLLSYPDFPNGPSRGYFSSYRLLSAPQLDTPERKSGVSETNRSCLANPCVTHSQGTFDCTGGRTGLASVLPVLDYASGCSIVTSGTAGGSKA